MVSQRITLKHQNYCKKIIENTTLRKNKLVYLSSLASNSIFEEIKFEASTSPIISNLVAS